MHPIVVLKLMRYLRPVDQGIIPSIARLPIPFGMIAWVICAFSLTGVAYDLIVLRRVHLTSIVGALLINVATPLRFIIVDTRAWQNVAEWIMKS